MNIGVLTSALDIGVAGGVANVALNLSNEISKRISKPVTIYSYENYSREYLRTNTSSLNIRLSPCLDPFKYGYSPSFRDNILNSDHDLIHAHGLWEYISTICTSWLRVRKKPYIISSHGMLEPWALNNSRLKKKILYYLIDRKYLANASAIQVLNQNEADSLLKLGIKSPVYIIPNGIKITNKEFEYPEKWLEYFGGQKKILLFLGRIHPKKGVAELIIAFKEIVNSEKSDIGDWRLAIYGWGNKNYVDHIKSIINKESLSKFVLFGNSIFGDEKLMVLQNASAFILPSKSEGYPIAVLEAWANKLPVLITEECNMNFAFEQNCAIKIHYAPDKLKNDLYSFFKMDDNTLEEIGLKSYLLAKNEYSWEKIANEYLQLYKDILT